MNVMSIRLNPKEQKWILKWAKQERKEKSEALRELLAFGWKFALLERYRTGKISLGRLARELNIPITETMDFLVQHGVNANLDYDHYLEGIAYLRKVA